MQQEDDTNDFGEHHDDVIGFAREGHTEEDAEDIERQERNDDNLNGLFDDSTELCEAFVEQLKLAGVQVESFVEPGVPHSYNVILNDSPQTIRFKNLRDEAVKQMFINPYP